MTNLLDVCSKPSSSCDIHKVGNGVDIMNNVVNKTIRGELTQVQKLTLHQKLTAQSGFNSIEKPKSAKVPNDTLIMFTKMLNKQYNAYPSSNLNESFVGNRRRGWRNVILSTRKGDIIVVLTLLFLLFCTI